MYTIIYSRGVFANHLAYLTPKTGACWARVVLLGAEGEEVKREAPTRGPTAVHNLTGFFLEWIALLPDARHANHPTFYNTQYH
jgi:hypothetical protein